MANTTIDLNEVGNLVFHSSNPFNSEFWSSFAKEGGAVSNLANPVPGMNSMSVFHDKFTQYTFLGAPGLLQLSIVPAIPINYYGLIGKSIRNLYEQPKNNNLTGVK